MSRSDKTPITGHRGSAGSALRAIRSGNGSIMTRVLYHDFRGSRISARRAQGVMEPTQLIREILERQGGIRLAILFGSLAKGRATRESDLDLAILTESPLTAETQMALIGELSVAFGRPIDLIDLRTVGEPLLGQILKHSIRLLGSDADYAELIKRHVFEEADFMPYRRRILAERRQAWIGK